MANKLSYWMSVLSFYGFHFNLPNLNKPLLKSCSIVSPLLSQLRIEEHVQVVGNSIRVYAIGFQGRFVMFKGVQEHVSPVNKLVFADNALEFTIVQRKGHAFP